MTILTVRPDRSTPGLFSGMRSSYLHGATETVSTTKLGVVMTRWRSDWAPTSLGRIGLPFLGTAYRRSHPRLTSLAPPPIGGRLANTAWNVGTIPRYVEPNYPILTHGDR